MDESSKVTLSKDPFSGSRKDINAAIDRICEFTGNYFLAVFVPLAQKINRLLPLSYVLYLIAILSVFPGTKVIFWDLRESFIDNLYKPSVSQCRLEILIEPLDLVRSLVNLWYLVFYTSTLPIS